MVDVFVRVCPLNKMRFYLSCASLLRWADLKGGRLQVILADVEEAPNVEAFVHETMRAVRSEPACDPPVHRLPLENFWTTSKQLAEDLSEERSDGDGIYVLADDDHLPIEEDWLDCGLRLMGIHRDFALLSGMSMQVQPGVRRMNVALDGTGEIVDGCVGAPYFMRRGSIGRFPECTIEMQDPAMCDQLRARGWRVGHALFCRYNHTAGHLSTALNFRSVGGPALVGQHGVSLGIGGGA